MATAMIPAPTAPVYGSPEWQLERRRFVQASDVPMILGVSPFGGPYDVFLAKQGLAENEENDAMWWGHVHEPGVARAYQRRFPEVTMEEVGTLTHPKYPWLRATVDRLVTHPTYGVFPLEIKTTSAYKGDEWGDEYTDAIPDHVMVQAQVQLMVLERSFGHAAVLVGGNDFRAPYIVEGDRELQEMILDRCHDFYERHIVNREEPAMSGPNVMEHLKRKYQTHSDVVVIADDTDRALLTAYFTAKADGEAAEAREKAAKTALMQRIGNNYGVKDDQVGKVIWYEVKGRESIDTKGLLAHLNVPQDVIQQYTRRGAPSRTFRGYPKGD